MYTYTAFILLLFYQFCIYVSRSLIRKSPAKAGDIEDYSWLSACGLAVVPSGCDAVVAAVVAAVCRSVVLLVDLVAEVLEVLL